MRSPGKAWGAALAAAIAILSPSVANATQGFYIGLGYQATSRDYKSAFGVNLSRTFDGALNGGEFYLGYRFVDWFALEAGYITTADASKHVAAGTKATVNTAGATLNGVAYVPISSRPNLELMGIAGVSNLTAKAKVVTASTALSADDTAIGARVGAGVQYGITDHFNLRVVILYEAADFRFTFARMPGFSLGVNYLF